MRSHSRTLPILLALASGLATTGLMYVYLKAQPQQAVPAATETMVVAASHLSESQPLGPEHMAVVPVAHRPDGAFATASDLAGRMPLVPIPKGQPVLSSHLAPVGAKPALWHRIPPGKRAVTVAIDEVAGVGGFLKPGLRVDIVSVARGEQAWITRTIVQNVPILALAQEDKTKQEDVSARVAPSATLLVTPQQAEAVSLATEQGKIRLVLRAPEDNAIVKLPAAKPAPVARAAAPEPQAATVAPAAVAPVPEPPRPAVVAPPQQPQAASGIEVIRGSQSEVVTP